MKTLFETSEFINSIRKESTGGNVINDIITLTDGKVIVITPDCIYYFNSITSYEANEDALYTLIR